MILAFFRVRRCARRFNRKEFLIHCYQYGPRILPKITLFAIIVSSFVVFFTIRELSSFQALGYLDNVLRILIIREAGPLLVAFFVIIYASVAIFDELEEIRMHPDASKNYDYDSFEFVYQEILPRLFAIVICMPLLYCYFAAVSFIVVCFWIRMSEQISLNTFLNQLAVAEVNYDIYIGLLKTFVFAGINAFFACFYGMQHMPDPQHKSLPLIKSILVNLGYLVLMDVVFESIAFRLNI